MTKPTLEEKFYNRLQNDSMSRTNIRQIAHDLALIAEEGKEVIAEDIAFNLIENIGDIREKLYWNLRDLLYKTKNNKKVRITLEVI